MSTHKTLSAETRQKITVPQLIKYKARRRRIAMITAYDATFARLLDQAGADILLIGDSLGMVIQGEENTLAVTVDEIIYHTRAVAQGARHSHIVADMPFMSYQSSVRDGVINAGRLIKEGRAEAVKIEGGLRNIPLIEQLVSAGIPVMGHLGLTPQSVHQLGGFKVQGRNDDAAQEMIEAADALQRAGCYAIVLEAIPDRLAVQITERLSVPTIGIGAGNGCDGQVLVCYDLLGMNPEFCPKFVKRYESLASRIQQATGQFIREVRDGAFPAAEHTFTSTSKQRARPQAETPSNISPLPVRKKQSRG